MTYYEDFLEIKGINAEPDLTMDDMEHMGEHVELVVDGVIDTMDQLEAVQGGEHYGLTHAQRYLQGALYARGIIPQTVHGNESVLTAVKDGLAKALKYVKDLFQKIWDFFFKKKEAKKTIEQARLTLKEAEDVSKTVEFKEKMKIIDIADDLKKRGETLQKLLTERAGVMKSAKENLDMHAAELKDEELYKEFKKYYDGFNFDDKLDSGIEDPIKAINISKNMVNDTAKFFEGLQTQGRYYQRRIDSLEMMMKNGIVKDDTKSPNADTNVKDHLALMKLWMSFISKLCTLNTRIINQCGSICAFIEKHK